MLSRSKSERQPSLGMVLPQKRTWRKGHGRTAVQRSFGTFLKILAATRHGVRGKGIRFSRKTRESRPVGVRKQRLHRSARLYPTTSRWLEQLLRLLHSGSERAGCTIGRVGSRDDQWRLFDRLLLRNTPGVIRKRKTIDY